MRSGGDALDVAHRLEVSRPLCAPAPSRMAPLLTQLRSLHPHICPRQVLGVRMGLYAGELLGIELPRNDRRLFVFVETDGCFADSIAVATGCWLGRRTLRLIDHGKTAATFADRQTGRAIRAWPDPAARVRAADYVPDAPDRWHAQRDGYQVMPPDRLLRAHPVVLDIDVDAVISRPGRRVACTACGEEVINEREVLVGEGTRCRACAGEPYLHPFGRPTDLS